MNTNCESSLELTIKCSISNIEIILFDLHHLRNSSLKDDFLTEMAKLSQQEYVSPLDISDLAYQIGLKIDIKILCTLLLRHSNSVSLIKGSSITNYFLPLFKTNANFPKTLTINNSNEVYTRQRSDDSEDLAELENNFQNKSHLIKKLTEGANK